MVTGENQGRPAWYHVLIHADKVRARVRRTRDAGGHAQLDAFDDLMQHKLDVKKVCIVRVEGRGLCTRAAGDLRARLHLQLVTLDDYGQILTSGWGPPPEHMHRLADELIPPLAALLVRAAATGWRI